MNAGTGCWIAKHPVRNNGGCDWVPMYQGNMPLSGSIQGTGRIIKSGMTDEDAEALMIQFFKSKFIRQ